MSGKINVVPLIKCPIMPWEGGSKTSMGQSPIICSVFFLKASLRHLAGLKWTFMHGMDYSHRLSINWPIVWNSLTRSSNRKANCSTTLLIIVNCNDWSFTFLLSIHFHQAKENILKFKSWAVSAALPSLNDDTRGLIRRAALSCYKLIFPLVWFHHAFMRWWLCCLDKEILRYN